MNLPWLPTTSATRRLDADLKERGWKVWWTRQGSVRLFAPDGATLEIHSATAAQTMSDAYASAQEYSNAPSLFAGDVPDAPRLSARDQAIEDLR